MSKLLVPLSRFWLLTISWYPKSLIYEPVSPTCFSMLNKDGSKRWPCPKKYSDGLKPSGPGLFLHFCSSVHPYPLLKMGTIFIASKTVQCRLVPARNRVWRKLKYLLYYVKTICTIWIKYKIKYKIKLQKWKQQIVSALLRLTLQWGQSRAEISLAVWHLLQAKFQQRQKHKSNKKMKGRAVVSHQEVLLSNEWHMQFFFE